MNINTNKSYFYLLSLFSFYSIINCCAQHRSNPPHHSVKTPTKDVPIVTVSWSDQLLSSVKDTCLKEGTSCLHLQSVL